MNAFQRILSIVLVAAGLAATASAADMLSDYQRLYTKTAYPSQKEDVLKGLVATGKPAALPALEYCVGVSRSAIDDAATTAEKLRPRLVAAQDKLDAAVREYYDKLRKAGNPDPDVKQRPMLPEDAELLKSQADVAAAEKTVIAEQDVLVEALDAHGALVAKLKPEEQKRVREDWKKSSLSSKDWGVRADCFEMIGHTPTDWALDLLVAAADPGSAEQEPDARALAVCIDGLSGKDAKKASPVLAARLDDVRWMVRVAAVHALEMTPSKEGIDALIKRYAKEDGRLKDDCAHALKALTGNETPTNAEMWRIWWEQNRDKWTGKPPAKEDKPKGSDPFAGLAPKKEAQDEKKTGFFGIEIESKRLVFVIDVSGSMFDPMGGNGPDAKTKKCVAAKEELKRVLGTLEDGSLFNIVFFATVVRVWKPEMQKADGKTRKEAQDYVDAAPVVGATNTYEALQAAFGLGDVGKGKKREADPTGEARVDTIMFLSDGEPTQGVTDKDQIRAAVKSWNRARRVMIHSIAFGTSVKGGADPKFMKGLADDTGGKYVEK